MYLLEGKIIKRHKHFEGDESVHVFIAEIVSQMYTYVKVFKLYTLNMCSPLYMNYTSIKLY